MAKYEGFGLTCGDYRSVDVGEKIFGGENTIFSQMKVEAAMATAQAEVGIIPKEAAEEINRKCDINLLDEAEYIRQYKITNHPLVCLVRTYADLCENGYGEYVHFGTTSQDIGDTANMLLLKQAYEVIQNKTQVLRDLLAGKAKEYRSLVMMGRTNDQQALPITLGFKMASWVDELDRSIERLAEAKGRIFVGQFGGAVGTMASLGEKGLEIQKRMMEILGLGVPDIAWYASRDRMAEMAGLLCILTGTLGRIGNEVYIGQKSELNELSEGFKPGKVGSSTMPHKRNPFVPGRLVGLSRMSRGAMMDALASMESTNERDCRVLFMETDYLAKIPMLADAALDTAIDLITNLEVHERAIVKNLNALNGLVFAEALMMRLSKDYGRNTAHEMIYEIAQQAISEGKSFRELLLADEKISSKISAQELDEIMEPANYIGLSEHFVDVIVEK